MTILYDMNGRPIDLKKSVRPVGEPPMADSVRNTAGDSIASGISPGRLASVLRNNDQGDMQELQTLSFEMEERHPHYWSLIQSRRLRITSAPMTILPGDASAEAEAIAEEFENEVVKKSGYQDLLDHLLDAIPRAYSAVAPVWDTTTRPWTIRRFEHYDCRLFQFDTETHKELRWRTPNDSDGKRITPGQLLIHTPKIRTGVPILRGGVARLAAVSWFLATSTVKDWKVFAEMYGMPLRIAYYDPADTDDRKKSALRTALMNLGHDAAAMLPRGMSIEFPDVRRPTSGDNVYSGIVEYFDKCLSKAILGQTMTSDDGSSLAQASIHENVALMIASSDAKTLCVTLDKLAAQWTALNYGDAPAPKHEIDVDPPEDRKLFTESTLPWLEKAGVKVPERWLRKKLQIPTPAKGEDMVGVVKEEPTQGPQGPQDPQKQKKAPNNAQIQGIPDTDSIIREAENEWRAALDPHRETAQTIADASTSYDDFLSKIDNFAKQVDSNPLLQAIARAGMKARGAGADV